MVELDESDWEAIRTSLNMKGADGFDMRGWFTGASTRKERVQSAYDDLVEAFENRDAEAIDEAAAQAYRALGGPASNAELFEMNVHPDANEIIGGGPRQVLYLTRGNEYWVEF